LLTYARKVNGIPLYLFYNYSNDLSLNEKIQQAWKIPISYFGCSFVEAKYIYLSFYKNQNYPNVTWHKIPSFFDLHGNNAAFPLEALTWFTDKKFLPIFLKHLKENFNFTDEPYLHYFLPREKGRIGGIEIGDVEEMQSTLQIESQQAFWPKYIVNFYF
jgi:hypothetical protein